MINIEVYALFHYKKRCQVTSNSYQLCLSAGNKRCQNDDKKIRRWFSVTKIGTKIGIGNIAFFISSEFM